jgi:hypothetical protein
LLVDSDVTLEVEDEAEEESEIEVEVEWNEASKKRARGSFPS